MESGVALAQAISKFEATATPSTKSGKGKSAYEEITSNKKDQGSIEHGKWFQQGSQCYTDHDQ